MIVIINGPLGIGKSETSWQLLYRFARGALLDADYLAAVHPFDHYNQDHLDYAYRTIGIVAAHHVANGITDLVVNWVFESPDQMARMVAALAPCGLPIYIFRLRCAPDEIERRVRQRNHADLAFEIERSRTLLAILDTAAQTGDLGVVIDTTHLSISEVVAAIWERIHA